MDIVKSSGYNHVPTVHISHVRLRFTPGWPVKMGAKIPTEVLRVFIERLPSFGVLAGATYFALDFNIAGEEHDGCALIYPSSRFDATPVLVAGL